MLLMTRKHPLTDNHSVILFCLAIHVHVSLERIKKFKLRKYSTLRDQIVVKMLAFN